MTILYLASSVGGIIERVSDDLHGVDVVTEDGSVVRFRLSAATARFVALGDDAGARLRFDARSSDEGSDLI